MVFFPFSAVTRLGASRLRIRQIEEILREHNRHRRDLALGVYGTTVSNMKKLVSFYFFLLRYFNNSDILPHIFQQFVRQTSK